MSWLWDKQSFNLKPTYMWETRMCQFTPNLKPFDCFPPSSKKRAVRKVRALLLGVCFLLNDQQLSRPSELSLVSPKRNQKVVKDLFENHQVFFWKEKTCLFQGLWVSHLLEKFQMEPTGLMIALAPRSTFRCGRDTLVYRGYLWAIGVLLVWREICMPEYVIIGCISKETILKSINFMFKWSISLLDFLLIPDLPLPRLKIVALHVQICWCWS